MIQRLLAHLAWPVRLLWIAVALVQNSFTVSTWIMWALPAVAMWILHPISLSVIRIASPGVIAVLISQLPDLDFMPTPVIAATIATVALLLVYTNDFGSAHVQAGAYGSEQRFLLRLPVSLIFPAFLSWLVMFGLLIGTEYFATNRDWFIAAAFAIVLIGSVWKLGKQLHRLSKRWLVRVPAGWVIHDGVLLAENLLIRTHQISSIQLAPAQTEALDLSGITRGIPLEITLREMTDVRLSTMLSKVTKTLDAVHVQQLLVAPKQTDLIVNK